MASQIRQFFSAFTATNAALVAKRFVKIAGRVNGNYTVSVGAANDHEIVGVTRQAVAANQVGDFVSRASGTTATVTAGAAIALGASVNSDAQGRAVPTPNNQETGILGFALVAAAAAGDDVEIYFI